METKYLDDLILHEYGTHDITKYNEWVSDWHKWLEDEKSTTKKSTNEKKLNQYHQKKHP